MRRAYSWITDDMFYDKLADILTAMKGDEILALGDVHSVLSEELNNRVLEELEEERCTCDVY